jgi:transcriptional regulator with XRE-family HTH domain
MTTLERLRREQGLDQKDLAARAGVAQSTVSRAESGGQLTAQTALALARALGVSVEALLGDVTLAPTGT